MLRVGVALLLFATGFLQPEAILGQRSPPSIRMQVSGLISGFRYERGPEAQWRSSSTLRFRLLRISDYWEGRLEHNSRVLSTPA